MKYLFLALIFAGCALTLRQFAKNGEAKRKATICINRNIIRYQGFQSKQTDTLDIASIR